MTPDLGPLLLEESRLRTRANLPPSQWEHVEKGRIYMRDGGLIAEIREQIPPGVDPDGDDPAAWAICDAAVEEAGRRAEYIAFLVNNARDIAMAAAAERVRSRDAEAQINALYRLAYGSVDIVIRERDNGLLEQMIRVNGDIPPGSTNIVGLVEGLIRQRDQAREELLVLRGANNG